MNTDNSVKQYKDNRKEYQQHSRLVTNNYRLDNKHNKHFYCEISHH